MFLLLRYYHGRQLRVLRLELSNVFVLSGYLWAFYLFVFKNWTDHC